MNTQPRDEALPADAAATATVLVVDDEEAIRSSVRRALSRSGYRVLEAQDMDEAVRQFGSADPQVEVVLLDMVLPGGGPRIFRQIRDIVSDIPVIISSGFMGQEQETVTQLLNEDRVYLLPKPYDLVQLYRVVGAALGGR